MKYQYANPWYSTRNLPYSTPVFQTDKEPMGYRGFRVFHPHESRFDIVNPDWVCVTQLAGGSKVKTWIDKYIAKDGEFVGNHFFPNW